MLGNNVHAQTLSTVTCSESKKGKVLRYFEEIFFYISGEDQLIQVDEFATALHTDDVGDHNIMQKLCTLLIEILFAVSVTACCSLHIIRKQQGINEYIIYI